jgi:outer membrane protein assembly factor BamB
MSLRRSLVLAAVLAAALGASACSTLGRLNPFDRNDEGPQETAGEGQRISIVPADQRLEPTEALKGVDFSLPPPAPVADWPLPGGAPEQALGHVEAGGELTVAWRKGFGSGSSRGRYITAPPIVAAGRIYVMDGEGRVAALDARNGSQVWRTSTNPGDNKRDRLAFGGGMAFHEGKLYVSSGFRQMLQLDAATGAVGWRTRTSEAIHGAPTIAAGRVMAVALDNSLLTFDLATGTPGWTFQALAESARILGASSPAVASDVVVAAFGSGELVAMRAANGNDLWNEALSRASRTSALSEIRDIPGRPAIYQGDVYAVSHSGVFAAIDLRTGQAKWSLPVVGVSSPWPAGDVVYVVSKTGELVCASRETGQIYWMRDLNEGFKAKRTGGVPGLTMLGITGQKLARPVWSGPLLANNRVILVGPKGELVAVNAKTGAIEKRMQIGGGSSLIAPIAAGGTIYVVTDEAQVIALR